MHRYPKDGIKSILGNDVKFVMVDPLKDEKGAYLLGMCDSDNNTIYILSGQKKKTQEETVIHEILHYVSDKLNLKLNHAQIHGITTGYMSVRGKR